MHIDARNLACPRPVVLALEALPKLKPGESLDILVNDDVASANLTRLAAEKGCALTTVAQGQETTLTLTPNAPVEQSASASAEAADFCEIPGRGDAVIVVDADTMGRGSEELGRILVKGLLYALAHQDQVPRLALFYNGGARLTCEGSESLDDIRELEARGTQILTCGTCLDFYGIRERLAVGGVTNLYEIAKVFAENPGVTVL
ncbi:sulfurtransferase-like selenium metabolism protein YedF [Olsenella sp. HMSC062G07]|uniref:sulfurtransferase-like selenium metabolism protein YedF n=1 Tax=Olsenella sp. HMSC062G07 TaxID=1739330 RepID=UPI0008A5E5F6|nr:sulfurtransferase-like selenium metabolism protein YedF [Olsenella sp. HMSC062G07]OFK23858.1 response regulator SirA [Olsenella sp. HMSC062G07]